VRGDLAIQPSDLAVWGRGSRFYPLLYMLTRACLAKDWGSGVALSQHLLGTFSQLHIHHIFPKSKLYEHGYSKPQVNAIANFTFLTQETNLLVSNRLPDEYLEEFVRKQPGAVGSHWIPMDRELWRIENYLDFLAARRELLAKAANDYLNSLLAAVVREIEVAAVPVELPEAVIPGGVASEEEEALLQQCNAWVTERGLPEGEYLYELVHPDTNEPLAVLDLAWPNGVQEGYSQPVALLIDETEETLDAANRAGYLYFTDIGAFQKYVAKDILALEDAAA
jgi:hypothetical protein